MFAPSRHYRSVRPTGRTTQLDATRRRLGRDGSSSPEMEQQKTGIASCWLTDNIFVRSVFALLALITALVALYGWLEPTYGVFPAVSIVGSVLAVIALVLISAAMILSRGRPGSEKGTATPKTIEVPPNPLPLSVTPAPVDPVNSSPSAASAATAGDKIEPFLSVVKRYAHILRTGSAPVDDFIRQMEPRVELATKEAVIRFPAHSFDVEGDLHGLAKQIGLSAMSRRIGTWRRSAII